MADEKRLDLINKWDVVNKLIQLENNYTFYKDVWDAQTLYRRICELEIGIGKTPTVDAVEVPPIKIGDTAYFIIHRKIYKAEVYFIRWEHHRQYGIHSEISANVGQYSTVGASFDDFGKTLFLTEEEAKAALAKMDGDGNG